MTNLPHWWQNGVIYQIYPKSFQDTTGSGTGDLRGVIQRLDYLHTSTQHAWFREALNKESPYRQFYIWRDGEPETPPNNWRSKFGGSAWRWHAESEQYYLHLFAPEQADLNWENPAVRAELKKVCEFWADRGVAPGCGESDLQRPAFP